MDALQEKLAAWLPENLLEELHSQKAAPAQNTQPWVLELNLAAIAASGHVELVHQVLANPRSVCVALWHYLASKDAFPRGSRVWLRTSMPWESNDIVPLSRSLQLTCAAPSSLRSFSGIVTGISSAEEDFVVEMTYECGVCGSEQRVFLDISCPTCCGFPMKHDLQRLVLAPARTILLAPATSTASASYPASTVAVPVLVRLRDDLAGSCHPGDFITCTGIAECIAESKVCTQGRAVLAQVRVEALHVHHPPPSLRFSDDFPEAPRLAAFGKNKWGLSSLIEALKDWLHPPCCSLTLAALLLSACSAASCSESPPSSEPSTKDEMQLIPDPECDTLGFTNFRNSKEKHRINILLLTGGHDNLETTLRSIAQALCCHVTNGSLPGSNLLPTALDIPGATALASVGQLAQANSGICLLPQNISAKQGRAIGEALRSGHAAVDLSGGRTCAVDIHLTVWCLSAAPDLLPKQQPAGKKFSKWGSSKNSVAPLAILFAEKSSPQLASQFDVIMDCASIEDIAAEAWADDYLSALVSGEREGDEGEETSNKEAARRALQSHITACQQLPQPTMTSSAMKLLKSYWTSMRAEAAADPGHGGGGGAMPAISLDTAAKLAAASARLFHSTEIRAFPDATLAIALSEEGSIARGRFSEMWGPLREQMVCGRDLEECLADLYSQLVRVSKVHKWEWGAQEE